MQDQEPKEGNYVDLDSVVLYGNAALEKDPGYSFASPESGFVNPAFTIEDETGVYVRMTEGEITLEKPLIIKGAERTDSEIYVDMYLTIVVTTILLVAIRCREILKDLKSEEDTNRNRG